MKTEKIACDFEKKYGRITFLKIASSAINKLLVEKGILTQEEIKTAFIKEVKNYGDIKRIKK